MIGIDYGLFRLSLFGYTLKFVDTSKRTPLFGDRTHGTQIGRFLVCFHRS